MKCRHRLMFISSSMSASSSFAPCLLLQVHVPPQQCHQLHSTTTVMLSSELGEKASREIMRSWMEGISGRQHPCQSKCTSNQCEGGYQNHQFVLHRGHMRNTAGLTCITCSVCPTVTSLFQTSNKYFNTNSNR